MEQAVAHRSTDAKREETEAHEPGSMNATIQRARKAARHTAANPLAVNPLQATRLQTQKTRKRNNPPSRNHNKKIKPDKSHIERKI